MAATGETRAKISSLQHDDELSIASFLVVQDKQAMRPGIACLDAQPR